MHANLQSWLIQARTRRRLTQQELANIAQVATATISTTERGVNQVWTPRIATSVGLALHEVQPLNEDEITEFCLLTDTPMHIFAQPATLTNRERDRRLLMPILDKLLDRFTAESVLVFMQSLEAVVTTLKPRASTSPEDQVGTHVVPPAVVSKKPKSGGKHA